MAKKSGQKAAEDLEDSESTSGDREADGETSEGGDSVDGDGGDPVDGDGGDLSSEDGTVESEPDDDDAGSQSSPVARQVYPRELGYDDPDERTPDDDHDDTDAPEPNSVERLADSLHAVVERMRAQDRRFHLNSFVAYILFTVLLGGGFFLLYQSRVGSLVKARSVATSERDAARERAVDLQNQLAKRDASAKIAYDYYSLIRDKRRTEVIAQYPQIENEPLTPAEREFFAEGVQRARAEMVDAGYLAGLDAYRRNDYERAITELERALAYEVEGQQSALMRYYLGVSLHRIGRSEEAVRPLELALAGRVSQVGVTDARYHMASAFEALGSLEEARKEFNKFANTHPQSPLAPSARRKAGMLGRLIVQRQRGLAVPGTAAAGWKGTGAAATGWKGGGAGPGTGNEAAPGNGAKEPAAKAPGGQSAPSGSAPAKPVPAIGAPAKPAPAKPAPAAAPQ